MIGTNIILYDEKFLETAIDIIRTAKKRIWVSSFKAELTTKPRGKRLMAFFNVLTKKVVDEKDVRFLLPIPEHGKHVPITNGYAITTLKKHKVKVRRLQAPRLCHAKIIIVDNSFAIIGSHNLSVKSCHNNFECSVLLKEPLDIRMLGLMYEQTWDNAK